MRAESHVRGRTGFTIVEVFVSLAIIGLLLALLLPAVASVREASRKMNCSSHLHQLGVGLSNVEQVERYFPVSFNQRRSMWPLLSYVEQGPLYKELTSNSPPASLPVVDAFLCPSDPVAYEFAGDVNYLYNDGTAFRDEAPLNGFASDYGKRTTVRDIRDGLSNTAAMSERLVATPGHYVPIAVDQLARSTGRYLWYTGTSLSSHGQEELAADICRTNLTSPSPFSFGPSAQGYEPNTGYDHLLSPNQTACYNQQIETRNSHNVRLIPPSSLHPGGVNVLMADGRVLFTSNSIGDPIWRAAGTRAGAESEMLR